MSILTYTKMLLLNSLLCWYRKHFDLDVDGVISPLDEVINDTARRIIADEEKSITI